MNAPKRRILVVEDDAHVAAGVVRGLRDAGFEVEIASTGEAAIRCALKDAPDLVVLDLMLPDLHGFEVLERLQGRTSVPVIVLTARTELDERLDAFGRGAIDFVPKPFFVRELVARIETHLRIKKQAPSRIVRWADVELDLDARTVKVAGATAPLTKVEHDVLAHLATRPGRPQSRAVIADAALDPLGPRDERTVDSHVARLRKKLGPAGIAVVTVWGIGYRFDPQEGA